MLTETDDLARALDDAAAAWPELRGDRPALLRRLTVAEALVHPARAGREASAMESLRAIGVDVLPITANSAEALARVRCEHRVRMPDAVALHAAVTTESALATFDDALAAAAERAGVVVAR
mgnify:CR=1 FL=1